MIQQQIPHCVSKNVFVFCSRQQTWAKKTQASIPKRESCYVGNLTTLFTCFELLQWQRGLTPRIPTRTMTALDQIYIHSHWSWEMHSQQIHRYTTPSGWKTCCYIVVFGICTNWLKQRRLKTDWKNESNESKKKKQLVEMSIHSMADYEPGKHLSSYNTKDSSVGQAL